jgi:hypothetical protein
MRNRYRLTAALSLERHQARGTASVRPLLLRVYYAADESNVGDVKPAHFGNPQSSERAEQHGHSQMIGHKPARLATFGHAEPKWQCHNRFRARLAAECIDR